MVMFLIREVQDLFDSFKKLLIAGIAGYLFYNIFVRYGSEVAISLAVFFSAMLVFYIMERFEELLEDMDRLRVTQLAWIAETGGELDEGSENE